MGAWGCGLQASDDALDWIGELETMKQFRKIPKLIRSAFRHKSDRGALALAEVALENGIDISKLRIPLNAAICREMALLDEWTRPKERKLILEEFRKRLNGKRYDKKAVARANRGLFEVACRKKKKGLVNVNA